MQSSILLIAPPNLRATISSALTRIPTIDSRKLQRELGWEPSLQFEEGIEHTIRWYYNNQEWIDNITSGEYERYYDEMYKNS